MKTPTSRGDLIRKREGMFPWFLLATLLPILVMPFSNFEGNVIQRLILPVVANLLVLQSLRIMPVTLWRNRRNGPGAGGRNIWLLTADGAYQSLGLLAAVVMWIPFLVGHRCPDVLRAWLLVIICAFYLLTAVRIVQLLSKLEGVNIRSLCLGCAGYVHLGLTAGQIATFIQVVAPRSFSLGRILPGEELVERLTYFSFVTLGSIGYGDVIPRTPNAEFFSVCLSITGTLYVSLVIGLLLSRYINDQTSSIEMKIEKEIRQVRD